MKDPLTVHPFFTVQSGQANLDPFLFFADLPISIINQNLIEQNISPSWNCGVWSQCYKISHCAWKWILKILWVSYLCADWWQKALVPTLPDWAIFMERKVAQELWSQHRWWHWYKETRSLGNLPIWKTCACMFHKITGNYIWNKSFKKWAHVTVAKS